MAERYGTGGEDLSGLIAKWQQQLAVRRQVLQATEQVTAATEQLASVTEAQQVSEGHAVSISNELATSRRQVAEATNQQVAAEVRARGAARATGEAYAAQLGIMRQLTRATVSEADARLMYAKATSGLGPAGRGPGGGLPPTALGPLGPSRQLGPGAPAPAPPLGAYYGGMAADRAAAAEKQYQQTLGASNAALAARGIASQRAQTLVTQLSNAEMRHGALSSEWITAAARGETTLRSLGNQVAITAGKFAGWVVAGAAVYGVFDAIKTLGEGAISSNNAVANLSRFIETGFNADKAKQQLRDLALETNTSIKEAGEAAAQFAKVFHNQDQAMAAARTALYLTKLDNLSLADSYKSLTAAVQGFHLPADKIKSLGDQINAVQREFGANVSQVVLGFGRAAGSYNIAGGSPEYLKALVATIVRSTSQSGTAAGTAVARSATRFIQQPSNQATLSSLAGVTNFENYDRVIDQVYRAIRQRHLGRPDINKLAQALAGPQLGSRAFTALLGNPDLFYGILHQTAPGKVSGTTEKEFQKRLQATGEQAHRVRVELENLGSSLEQAGAAAPLREMLSILQAIFHVTDDIVKGFTGLPAPIQTAAELLTGMVIAIAAVRKFSSPESKIAGFVPGLSGGSGGRFARATLRGGVEQATQDYFSAATSATNAEKQAERATAERVQYAEANAGLLAKAAGTEEEQVAAQERMTALTRASEAAIGRANAAQSALNYEYANLLAKQELMAGLPRGAAAQRRYLAQNDLYALTGAPGTKNQVVGPEGQLYPATPVGRARQAAEEGRAADAARSATAAEAEVGAKASLFSRGLTGVQGATEAARGSLARIAAADAGSALALMGGPIGAAIAALILIPAIISEFSDAVTRGSHEADQLGRGPTSRVQQQRAIRRGLREQRDQQTQSGDYGFFGGLIQDVFTGPALGYDPRALRAREADIQLRDQQTQMSLLARRRAGQYQGPISNQMTSTIRAEASGYVKAYKDHKLTLDQTVGFLNDALKDVAVSSATPAKKALAKTDINNLIQRITSEHKGQKQSLEKAFEAMDPKNFQQTLQDDAAFIQEIGGRPRQWRDLQAAYTAATRLAKRHPDDKNNIKRLQSIHQAIQTAQQSILTDLQDAFDASTGPQQDQRAIDHAIAQANKLPAGKPRRRAVAAVTKAAAQEIQQTLQDSFALSTGAAGDERAIDRALAEAKKLPPGRQRQIAINQIAQAGIQQIDTALTDNLALGQGEGQRQRAFDAALSELRRLPPSRHRAAAIQSVLDKRYQDQITEIQANATLAEGNASSAGQADAIQISAIDAQIAAARKAHESDVVIKGLLAQRQQAVAQQAQDAIALADAYSSLSAAGIPSYDPVAQARAAASGAASHLGAVVANKKGLGKGFQVEYINALAAVKNANQAVNEAIQRQTEETAQARFDYLESLTTDPVAIDKLKISADTEALGAAHTQADKYKARAQRNQDRAQLLQDRISQREDDVQFALDMHKISAQQAIGELNDLLKVHNLSKAQRREIARRIQSLRDQVSQEASGFDLDVGTLKLPTIYDVRRAFDPIRHAIRAEGDRALRSHDAGGFHHRGPSHRDLAAAGTTVHAQVNVYVNDKGSVHEVYDALDHVIGTHVKSSLRSRGHRRVR